MSNLETSPFMQYLNFQQSDGKIQLELYIRVVSEASFRLYTLYAINSVDRSSLQATLKRRMYILYVYNYKLMY